MRHPCMADNPYTSLPSPPFAETYNKQGVSCCCIDYAGQRCLVFIRIVDLIIQLRPRVMANLDRLLVVFPLRVGIRIEATAYDRHDVRVVRNVGKVKVMGKCEWKQELLCMTQMSILRGVGCRGACNNTINSAIKLYQYGPSPQQAPTESDPSFTFGLQLAIEIPPSCNAGRIEVRIEHERASQKKNRQRDAGFGGSSGDPTGYSRRQFYFWSLGGDAKKNVVRYIERICFQRGALFLVSTCVLCV
jgi:hypothetical protein